MATATTISQLRIIVTQDGLVMDIVIKSITTWTATTVVENVVDVMSKYSTAQNANALTQLETCSQQQQLVQ